MDGKLEQLIDTNNRLSELDAEAKETRTKRNNLVKELRRNKVTARKLSDILGISEQSIHKIVKGQ